jgi:acyl carrier protein
MNPLPQAVDIDDIGPVVCEIVARALAIPATAVTLDANLMDDLGAESLDFLDIVFQLEHRFGVEITRGALERAARGDMSDEEFAPDGVLSPAGLARLRELLPEAGQRIMEGLRPRQILSLFSVRTFARIVGHQLGAAS